MKKITTNYTFQYNPHITKYLTLESDHDIDENSLKKAVPSVFQKPKNGEINVVFLNLTQKDWDDLGIRSSLWGQSRVIDSVIYCYGRWNERSDYQRSHKFDAPVNKMKELTIGFGHESSHGINNVKGKEDLTHAYFYGFKEKRKYAKGREPSRYQVKPDAIAAMDYALDDGDVVNFYCIRTAPITDRWEKSLRDLDKMIHRTSTQNAFNKLENGLNKISNLFTRAKNISSHR